MFQEYAYLWPTVLCMALSLIFLALLFLYHRLPFRYRNRRFQWNVNGPWHADASPGDLFNCPLLIDAAGISLKLQEGRLFISLDRVEAWVLVAGDEDAGEQVVLRAKDKGTWGLKLSKALLIAISRRIVLEIRHGVSIRVASKRKHMITSLDRTYYLHLKLASLFVGWGFSPIRPLSVTAISLCEAYSTGSAIEENNVFNIERIVLESTGVETVIDVGDHLCIDISITFVMLLASFIDRQKVKTIVKPSNQAIRLSPRIEVPLPDITARLRLVSQVTLTVHIPVTEPELRCLDYAQVSILGIAGQVSVKDFNPFFCLNINRLTVGAQFVGECKRSAETYCKVDALWEESLVEHADLIVIDNFCISDYGATDFGFSSEQLKGHIAKMRDGEGPWWWKEQAGFRPEEYMKMLDKISNPLPFHVDRTKLGVGEYVVMAFGTMDSIKLCVPSEFPFGFLFDQIVYIYKSAFKGETWDIISSAEADFIIRISSKQILVEFGDDDVDVAIGRVLHCKQLLLEQSEIAKQHLGSESSVSSESVFNEFRKICNSFREQRTTSDDKLMTVNGNDMVLQVQWKVDWSQVNVSSARSEISSNEGMAELLGGISEEQQLNVPLLSKMDTLIGGHIEMSVMNLSVGFRDYAMPLLSAPQLRLHGLLFLVELIPESGAVLRIPMSVYPTGGSSNLSRAPKGDSFVLKNTNPIKVFHCVNCIAHGSKLTQIAFSPRWLPAFQQMDRLVENFSSPTADPSPILPIWDKVRYLLRGKFSTLNVTSPCNFDLLIGSTVQSIEERLTIALPEGTKLAQRPNGRINWNIRRGILLCNSKKLSLLRHHMNSEGLAFAKHDKSNALYLSHGSILILNIPNCLIKAQFIFKNAKGDDCVDHFAVKTTCRQHASPEHDSFAEFRSDRITMKLSMDESQQSRPSSAKGDKIVSICYYRELEDWLSNSLDKIVDVPCKKGRLWKTAFVPQHRPIDIKRFLKDISVKVRMQNLPLSIRMLSFHSTDQFSGVHVSASGYNIFYNWRRKGNRYKTLYGEWDINDGKIACFSSDVQVIKQEFSMEIVDNIYGVEVLRAPVISLNSINETLFDSKRDVQLLVNRLRTIEEEKEYRTSELDTSPKELDERHRKRTLSVFKAQYDFLKEALARIADDSQQQMARRLYTAFDPNVSWSEDCRDIIYTIIYQQSVRQEFQFARSRKMDSLIKDVVSFFAQEESQKIASSMGLAWGHSKFEKSKSTTHVVSDYDIINRLFQELVDHARLTGASRIAEPDLSHASGSRGVDLRGPLELDAFYDILVHTRIKLVNPQVIFEVPLLSPDEPVKSRAVLLVVPEVDIDTSKMYKKGVNLRDDKERPLGRRVKVSIGSAQLYVVPREYEGDVFLSHFSDANPVYGRITDKISISFVYDISFSAAQDGDPIFSPSIGDSIRVYCPSFAVRTKSAEFISVFTSITRLLVYRDVKWSHRSEEKAKVYREAVIGKTDALQSLAQFLMSCKDMCERLELRLEDAMSEGGTEEIQSTLCQLEEKQLELSVLAEALLAMKSEQEKFAQQQNRLLLDLTLEEAAWTLLDDEGKRLAGIILTGIHDEWLSDSDRSVGTIFEVVSITADTALSSKESTDQRILEPLTQSLADRLGATVPGLSDIASNVIRFSFKASQGRSVGSQRTIEHAELFLSPLRVQIRQEQANRLFYFFFPKMPPAAAAAAADQIEAPNTAPRRTPSITMDKPEAKPPSSLIHTYSKKPPAKDRMNFAAISVPASNHLISFKTDTGKPDDLARIMDISDFVLKLPDIEYTNEQCTWDDIAIKLRNDAILILLKNAGSLIKQKFQSTTIRQTAGLIKGDGDDQWGETVESFYRQERLPSVDVEGGSADDTDGHNETRPSSVDSSDRGEEDRRERVERVSKDEQERKGRFLFGRYFHQTHK